MEDVKESVKKLFGEEYISLSMLDKPVSVPKEKCKHLSPLLDCNIGGSAHLGCMDGNFHAHCKLRLLHEKKSKS